MVVTHGGHPSAHLAQSWAPVSSGSWGLGLVLGRVAGLAQVHFY